MTRSTRRRRAAVLASVSLSAVTVTALAAPPAHAGPGDFDLTFGGDGRVVVEDLAGESVVMAPQRDGRIVLAEDATVLRLDPDGSRDERFGKRTLRGPGGAPAVLTAALVQPDGRILLAGRVADDMGFWRLRPGGRPDRGFGTGGFQSIGDPGVSDLVADIALDESGRVVAVGHSAADILVLRLTGGGDFDFTFNQGSTLLSLPLAGTDTARAVDVQTDGAIVLTGSVSAANGLPVLRVLPGSESTAARLDPDFGGAGTGIAIVPSLQPTGSDLVARPDGSTVALGAVAGVSPAQGTVVRLDSNGIVDDQFGSATGVHVATADPVRLTDLTGLRGGGLATGGVVEPAVGPLRPLLAVLQADGTPDEGFGAAGLKTLPGSGGLHAVAGQHDGRLVVVGGGTYLYRLVGHLAPARCNGRRATMVGSRLADAMRGTSGADVIVGLGGGDRIRGLGKGDVVCGGAGADRIRGGAGPDRLLGGGGPDRLLGEGGRDVLKGGPGRDVVRQ